MISGGKKFLKPQRTKFKKNRDFENVEKNNKKKHHDKSFYRLAKEEKEEYVV